MNRAQTEGEHSKPQGRSHPQACVTRLCLMMNTKTKTFSQQEVFYRTCMVIAVTGFRTALSLGRESVAGGQGCLQSSSLGPGTG